MVKQMNNKILSEVDKIIEYIKDTDDYKDYIYLKEKLSKNEKANKLINEIKNLQKDIVKLELESKDITELDNKINNNLQELNKIPLYVEYIQKQEILNDVYQTIKNRLDDYFYDKFNQINRKLFIFLDATFSFPSID